MISTFVSLIFYLAKIAPQNLTLAHLKHNFEMFLLLNCKSKTKTIFTWQKVFPEILPMFVLLGEERFSYARRQPSMNLPFLIQKRENFPVLF